ncbi:MAG: hypothetical protein QOC60_1442 [Frankiaceae bacterium]|nr:hypothetical protein [Frankiaceae bacterium]
MSSPEDKIGPVRPDVQALDVGDCLAVYVPDTQRALTLNRSAADVYLLSTGEHSVADIVRLLAASYGVREDDIRHDVVAAVENLRVEGLFA